MEALAFTLAFGVVLIMAIIMLINNIISAYKDSKKCSHQYDWGKAIENDDPVRCVYCGEEFTNPYKN